MFKNFVHKSSRIACRRLFTNRVKVFKFLSPSIKTSVDGSKLPPPTRIDKRTVEQLEKLSLVGFNYEKGVTVLEDAIRFADQILEVNTAKIKPLVTVLENESLPLREDIAANDVTRKDLMSHCKLSEENYFVSPIAKVEYPNKEKFTGERKSEVNNSVELVSQQKA